jgi:hypothetical protein
MDYNLKDQQETCGMSPPSELSKDLSDTDIKVWWSVSSFAKTTISTG